MTQPSTPKRTESPLRHVSREFAARLARGGSHLRRDDRAASAVLGTMFAFALVVSVVAMVQVSAVPAWNQKTEFEHLGTVEREFAAFDERVAGASTGTPSRATFDTGVTYPTRALFVSPPGGAGSLQTTAPAPARIEGAVATGETGTYWDGSAHTFAAQQFVFRPDYTYFQSDPSFVHEGSAQYTAYRNGNDTGEVGATQSLVDGTRISLVLLEGDVAVASGEATTVGVVPLSAGTDYITVTDDGTPITVSVPTRLSESTWRDLLADEPNVRSVSYATGADVNRVTVELATGKTYDLHVARVGIDTPGAAPEPAYIVDVEGDDAVVPPASNHRVVVEVRDAQNNPVANARVRASPGLTAESGRVAARDTGTTTTVTDADGRATFVYGATSSIDGVVSDQFDVVVEDEAGADIDRVTFDVQLRLQGVTDPVRGLRAPVDDPGSPYDDLLGDGEYDPATDVLLSDLDDGNGVHYRAVNGTLVVPPSTDLVTDGPVTLEGEGVSLHADIVTTGTNAPVTIDASDGSVHAVGVSVTTVKTGDISVSATEDIDLSGASVSQAGKGSLTIAAGGDVDVDNAGLTAIEPGETIRVESTGGFVSAQSADLSGNGDVVVAGTTGVDLNGGALSGVKDNLGLYVASSTGGVDLNGVVMLGDGGIDVDAEGDVYVLGANVASSKGNANSDAHITSRAGMVSGREAAVSAKGDVVITAATRITLPDSSIDAGGSVSLNAPDVEA